ncbi:MAG: hypothetical protein N3H31_06790 [Candidatus Nezhaarchaeota archaeon]|nr:hypothetical protein [Candidatus Nezhaarchaeota archaeon]
MAKRAVALLLSLALAVALVAIVLGAYSTSAQGAAVGKWLPHNNVKPEVGKQFLAGLAGCRWKGLVGVEVSEEFKERVVSIATKDPDVQSLVNEGYEVAAVRPVVRAVVLGDGSVAMKATGAVLILSKEGAKGKACVWVDVEKEKVVKIVVTTVKVVEKS